MSENKKKIGERIREFALNKYGSIAPLAHALEMKPQSLHTYLNGDSLPGFEIMQKLQKLGCDINWLLNGNERQIEADPIAERTKKLEAEVRQLKEELKSYKEIMKRINKESEKVIEGR